MRHLRFVSLPLFSLAFLASAGAEDDWIPLFNGKDLEGWVQRGGEANYAVEDGAIVGTTVPKTPNSFLCTEKEYGDFVLEVEFQVDPELNSGVQFRSESKAEYENGRVHGYQCEIDPSDRGWTGGIYGEGKRGWLAPLGNNLRARYAFRQGEWNRFRIVAVGNRLRTWINGVPAASLDDEEPVKKGFIALQVHGVGNREDPIQVRWRNVRIQEIADPASDEAKALIAAHEPAPAEVPEGPIFPDAGEIRKLAEGFQFTEGPALGPDGRIYFNDIPNERTHVYDPESGETAVFREETGRANGLFFLPSNALVACEGGNRQVTRQAADGEITEITVIADSFDGKKLNSPNDLVIDPVGGIYFTDPHYGRDKSGLELGVEAVYYLDRKRKITQVANNLTKPNGIIFSPDYGTLYIADPGAETIFAYDVKGEGKIENQRKFAEVGSDGMTVDTAGNIYVTWKGEVIAFAPDGTEVGRLAFPEGPANCLLVGNTLYVTARTAFYAVDLNATGLLP